MTQMRVLIAVTSPISLRLFGNRLHLLVSSGIDLHLVTGEPVSENFPEIPSSATLHVVEMKRNINPYGDLLALKRFAQLTRKIRPAMVAAATPKASLIAIVGARITRVPVRLWEAWGARWDRDTNRLNRILKLADRLVARNSSHIFAVSSSLARLMQESGITEERPRVIRFGSSHGVDTSHYVPNYTKSDDQSLTLGYVGRISQDKGIDDLYCVALELREQWPALRLLLVGEIDTSDPPPSRLVDSLINLPWVHHTGWVNDSAPYYQEMDIFLFPSFREGLPNAVLEADSSGLPVVAYQATGTVDAVEHGVNGLLVPLGDRGNLRDAVIEILNSSELRESFSSQSRLLATSKFDSTKVEAAWTNAYLKLLLET